MRKLFDFLKREKFTALSVIMTLVCIFAGGGVLMADPSVVITPSGKPNPTPGQAGLNTQLPGQPTTVSNAAEATGGVGGDGLIQPDIDDDIFLIGTDETVLDGLMRKARKKTLVSSFEVDHYLIDESKAYALTTESYTAAQAEQAVVKVAAADCNLFQDYGTVLARGVNGYAEDGKTAIPGSDLMLFVVGKDSTNSPIFRAVNGPKTNKTDEFCTLPDIPAGTKLILLNNACAETQKFVAPSTVVPTPMRVYLQKMILNEIISDYFDSQKKRIPFAEATIAEAVIKDFRRRSNRTLWMGQKSKFKVNRGEMGQQTVYTTEGLRWQFKRQYDHVGSWTFEEIIALAKLKFTGQNCSKKAFWLMGKNQLESIQNIDFTKHKDITMTGDTAWGFEVTKLHTVFGDFYIKHEPTLDYLDCSNSGAIIDLDGLVRYYMKNEETTTEKVEGEEAKRKCIITINALALKGTSHIWVNGEDGASDLPGAVTIKTWSDASNAPDSPATGDTYYLLSACTAISGSAKGDIYQWDGAKWVKYDGTIYIKDGAA